MELFYRIFIVVLCVALILLLYFTSYGDFEVTTQELKSEKLVGSVRLALVADLHSTLYGANQERLVAALERARPDLLLFAGDIVDDKRAPDGAERLFSRVGQRYPCYYVTGNHEFRTEDPGALKRRIAAYGIHVLAGDTEVLSVRGNTISVGGIDDRAVGEVWTEQISRADKARSGFSLLLSHRPDLKNTYARYGFDLVLCGHAHGGQLRLPFGDVGLIAPGQGLFPKYASGLYTLPNGTVMAVSRGLCKNWAPRTFNPPELMILDLKGEN